MVRLLNSNAARPHSDLRLRAVLPLQWIAFTSHRVVTSHILLLPSWTVYYLQRRRLLARRPYDDGIPFCFLECTDRDHATPICRIRGSSSMTHLAALEEVIRPSVFLLSGHRRPPPPHIGLSRLRQRRKERDDREKDSQRPPPPPPPPPPDPTLAAAPQIEIPPPPISDHPKRILVKRPRRLPPFVRGARRSLVELNQGCVWVGIRLRSVHENVDNSPAAAYCELPWNKCVAQWPHISNLYYFHRLTASVQVVRPPLFFFFMDEMTREVSTTPRHSKTCLGIRRLRSIG